MDGSSILDWSGEGAGEDQGVVGYTEYHDEGHYDQGEGGDSKGSSACCLMLMGFVLFPASLFLLGWNEKNSVCQSHIIMNAEDDAVIGECGNPSSSEGKFTFYSCAVDDESLTAWTPGTSFNTPGLANFVNFSSIAAAQKIEMYQCIETKEEVKTSKSSTSQSNQNSQDDQDISLLEKEETQKEETEVQTGHRKYRKGASKGGEQGQILSVGASGQIQSVVRSEAKSTETRRRRSEPKSQSTTATVYKYHMGWADAHYNSREFKATPDNIKEGCPDFIINGQTNHNPNVPDRGDGQKAELGRQLVAATNVVAGGYTLSNEKELSKLTADEPVSMTRFAAAFTLPVGSSNQVTSLKPSTLAVHPDSPHYLSTCNADRLGCVRISYTMSGVTHLSVLGQTGGAGVMEESPIEEKWGCGGTNFIRMEPTELTKEEFIAMMKAEKAALTWGLRAAGLLLAWLSLYCCFQPISAAADMAGDVLAWVPFVGESLESMLEGVVEMFLCLISCGFGLSCGLFMIALVWVGMRPMVGGPLMLGVVVLFGIGYCGLRNADKDPNKMRKNKWAQQQQPYYQNQQQVQQQGPMVFG